MTGQQVRAHEVFERASRVLLAEHPGDERGRMLSAPGLRTGGSFYAFATAEDVIVKLPAPRVAELVATGEGRPCSLGGRRPMREWVRLAPVDEDDCVEHLRDARAFVAHTD